MTEILDFLFNNVANLLSVLYGYLLSLYQTITEKPAFAIPTILVAVVFIWLFLRFARVLWLYIVAANPFFGRITRVVRCADGDTVIVGNPKNNRRRMKVRLIGIDTPESMRSMYMDVMPFGKEASDYARKRLTQGKRVILLYDKKKKDDFGRTLAYLYLGNGECFNATLVRNGYAFSEKYPPNVRLFNRFEKLQAKAKAERKGLWRVYKNKKELTDRYKQTDDWQRFRQHNYANRPK